MECSKIYHKYAGGPSPAKTSRQGHLVSKASPPSDARARERERASGKDRQRRVPRIISMVSGGAPHGTSMADGGSSTRVLHGWRRELCVSPPWLGRAPRRTSMAAGGSSVSDLHGRWPEGASRDPSMAGGGAQPQGRHRFTHRHVLHTEELVPRGRLKALV